MRTYTFGRCIDLLDVDAKVFRRWVREDLGLSKKDQRSKADSRVRYLTEEQLHQLAELHDITLPPKDQLAADHEEASPGAYKLLEDRLTTMEEAFSHVAHNVAEGTSNLTAALARLQEVEQRLGQSDQYYKELLTRTERIPTLESQLTERFTSLEAQIQALSTGSEQLREREAKIQAITTPQTPAEDQRIAELEAHYQQRIAKLEAQLALYKQREKKPAPSPLPKKKPVKKKRHTAIKALPASLVARNAFAKLHTISEKQVSKAALDGKIATTEGKWLSPDGYVVTRALNEKGKHDFYQVFHERVDFKTCEQCPHEIQE